MLEMLNFRVFFKCVSWKLICLWYVKAATVSEIIQNMVLIFIFQDSQDPLNPIVFVFLNET